MPPEIHAFFERTRDPNARPPRRGDPGFPPAFEPVDLDRSLVEAFYPAIEAEPLLYEYHARLMLRALPGIRHRMAPRGEPEGRFHHAVGPRGLRIGGGRLRRLLGPLGNGFMGRPGSRPRILVTGASNVQGVCSHRATFSFQVEKRLGAGPWSRRPRVLNAGCGTYNFYNFAAVLEEFADLGPDLFLVVAYTGNDFFGGTKLWRAVHGLGPGRGGAIDPMPLAKSGDPRMEQLLGVEVGQAAYIANNPEERDTGLALGCAASRWIARRAGELGVRALFACLPGPLTGQPDQWSDARAEIHRRIGLPSAALDLGDEIGDQWMDFLAREGLPALDLRPPIRAARERLYYACDGHLNPAGHGVVAAHLAPFVAAHLAEVGDAREASSRR